MKWGSKKDSGVCSPQGSGAHRQAMLVNSSETWHHLWERSQKDISDEETSPEGKTGKQ